MRTFEVVAALVIALVLFTALKLIGLLLKFALIAAAIGFIAGLWLTRASRDRFS